MGRAIASYFVSVTVGVFVLVVLTALSLGLERLGGPGHLFVAGVLFVILWVLCAVTAALPCALLSLVTREYGSAVSWKTYAGAAVIFAVLLGSAIVGIASSYHFYSDGPDMSGHTTSQTMQRMWSIFAVSGALAGLTYWALAGRRSRRNRQL